LTPICWPDSWFVLNISGYKDGLLQCDKSLVPTTTTVYYWSDDHVCILRVLKVVNYHIQVLNEKRSWNTNRNSGDERLTHCPRFGMKSIHGTHHHVPTKGASRREKLSETYKGPWGQKRETANQHVIIIIILEGATPRMHSH
jgi:hypothetical protein